MCLLFILNHNRYTYTYVQGCEIAGEYYLDLDLIGTVIDKKFAKS